VSYTTPGYLLAKKIEKTIEQYRSRYGRDPAIIFLQNHGLIITSENANTALWLVRKTVRKCRNRLKKPKAGKARPVSRQQIIEAGSVIRDVIFQMTGRKITVRHYINDTIAEFMAGKDAARLCSQPVVTGDELICVGGPPIWLDKWGKQTILDKSKHRIGNKLKQPVCFLIRPLGLFVAGDKGRQELMKDIITANLAVRSYASGFGGASCLNKRHLKFLANIEVR
jgi:rhamnose utilization protein RhaD (predicted bifunctional aldolase and dehydrogenase)